MPAGDNNRPNLMASPYLGLRHLVLWKDISVKGKMKSFVIIFLSAATAAVLGSNPCLNNEEVYFPDPEGGGNFHRLTFHDFSCRLQLVL